ncbi:hypothetical protein AC579_1203 [Pseudocercospora musae]|uniref:Transcription factor domain-containing protein n=1 Tax=Pseudocercospora musae TaxID=113226 RepID=A0A139I6L6_9PEZI|nr:hypothetical protein AC579_1203 [Pseudocercospora musae]
MMVLCICEMFQAFTIEGGETGRSQRWNLHLDAVQRYMRACGPAKDLIKSDFDWKLFQNIRFCSLYLSMAKRTHSLFEEPEWLELSRERSKSDPAVALYDIRARVPGLLARCDKLMEHETLYTSDLTSLYNDLYALRCDFGSWTISFGGTLGFATLPQDLNLPQDAFADGQDDVCYTFTDSNHASLRTSCWMMSLAVEGTVLRLLYAYEDYVATASAPFIRPEIERAAYETATNLCRSVHWCCQPSIAQSPYVGNFILKFAKAYFELVGLTNESNWCDAMASAVHTQTQSCHEAAGQKSLLSALSQRPAGDDRFLSGVWLGRNPCQIFIDIAV